MSLWKKLTVLSSRVSVSHDSFVKADCWCVLGVEGELVLEHDGEGIDTDGNLDNRGIYYYVADAEVGTFSFMIPLPSEDTYPKKISSMLSTSRLPKSG